MSIRKVSDLEGLDFAQVEDKDDILNSLFEVSFPEHENGFHAYKSMYTRYENIRLDILSAILSAPRGEIVFNETCHFLSTCYFYNGVHISGNFTVNEDVPDTWIIQNHTSTYLKNWDNYIIALHNNYLCALNENIIQAPTTKICSLTQILADFTDNNITLYRPTTFTQNVTMNGSLTVGGTVTANTFNGTATRALWADLAECYKSDKQYEPGTLVKFGGNQEITIADGRVNAVVTTKPGFLLNDKDDEKFLGIALAGRVPVKVVGTARKFDKLVLSEIPGVARVVEDGQYVKKPVGIVLEDKDDEAVGTVECAVQMIL